jgi:hypothetical protein
MAMSEILDPASERPRKKRVRKTIVSQPGGAEGERLLTRRQLASRWACSGETIKRRTRAGLLYPVHFGPRMLRYRLSDILRIEGGQ